MKKVLFLIHDLGPGGAEKVLVNLVNNMDHTQFDITVMSLFDEGVNRQFLSPKVTYQYCFKKMIRGNSHLMKLLSPQRLHRWLIKEHYDVEVAYLEGPCARIISGCTDPRTKTAGWIHSTVHSDAELAIGFRNAQEAKKSYCQLNTLIFVSEGVKTAFSHHCPCSAPTYILHNTMDTSKILQLAQEDLESDFFRDEDFCICGTGKLTQNKGFHRLIPIIKRLREDGLPAHLYLLGDGPMRSELEALAKQLDIPHHVTFLGYQTNPYKYVAKCDLFVCASHAEGFSTAATEALIVGTPVCTVEVSGMKEMLGKHNEWGVVTENDDEALYQGIRMFLSDASLLAHYKTMAKQRGVAFRTEATVAAVQEMLRNL